MLENLTYDTHQYNTYNPGCYNEIQKYIKMCTEFKAEVTSIMSQQFKITLILLVIMITYKIYVDNKEPQFSKTEFYQRYIRYRIDFIIIILAFISIAFLFM